MIIAGVTGSAHGQYVQQAKLLGSGAIGQAHQGASVAISADGNTAIWGGPPDNNRLGAAWVFTRSGGVWVQQAKLVGSGAVQTAFGVDQGQSVALSSDGNTAIVGGRSDNSSYGAAWVFTRSGGVWSEQAKLVGSGGVGTQLYQGSAVALSSDGNTAAVGGIGDNHFLGAVWVFTRSVGVWSQQAKLVGTGAVGMADQGSSVALSGDGNTVLFGGRQDNNSAGAVWVFTRSGGVWTQQGSKLVGTGVVGPYAAEQGASVAVSTSGNTAIVGGPNDSGLLGAAWVFTRSGAVWTQEGKLVGTGAVGTPIFQGISVALSGDGSTALIGGTFDDNQNGATWVFKRTGTVWAQQGSKLVGTDGVFPHQGQVALSADASTAIIGGPNADGAIWAFIQTGTLLSSPVAQIPFGFTNSYALPATASVPVNSSPGGVGFIATASGGTWLSVSPSSGTAGITSVTVQANPAGLIHGLYTGSVTIAPAVMGTSNTLTIPVTIKVGPPNLLWSNSSTAQATTWFMGGVLGNQLLGSLWTNQTIVPGWQIVGTADFNGDGYYDIVWFNKNNGVATVWLMGGAYGNQMQSWNWINSNIVTGWTIAATADFNRDGHPDIVWVNNTTGQATIWYMGAVPAGSTGVVPFLGSLWLNQAGAPGWTIRTAGDFNGDSIPDVVWVNNTTGYATLWLMGGAYGSDLQSWNWINANNAAGWSISGAGDFNGDGNLDVLWTNLTTGETTMWYLGRPLASAGAVVPFLGSMWAYQGKAAAGWWPVTGI